MEPGPPRWGALLVAQQALVMASASAVLGPLCDGLHSAHGVLTYADPVHLATPGGLLRLDTTPWTPALFALAGAILGVSHPLLDARLPGAQEPRAGREPPWAAVLAGIASFVLCYYASAALDEPLQGARLGPLPALDVLLCGAAAAQWAALDGTRQGLAMAALTAVAGPALEVALIQRGLYAYAHPQLFGAIPSWIAFVYAVGSPAVGNLGRKTAGALRRRQRRALRPGR